MFNTEGLKIIPGTDPLLRNKSQPILRPESPETKALVKQMAKTLHLNNGIGLAAPQVGYFFRLFIIELDYQLYVFINPEIKNLSRDKESMEEGCLSFPGMFRQVERSKKVTIKYQDETGKKQRLKAKGLLARAIQHEFDHLEGILLPDRCQN
jgi:peptide deformylase